MPRYSYRAINEGGAIVKGEITFTPHADAITQKKSIEPDLFRLVQMLAV